MLLLTVYVVNAFFAAAVVCMPLSDQGPHIDHGWTQVVRLRHLYAARPGLHLLISGDGQIHGSTVQTLHSLLEIRPVDPGCVAIRGVATARFLCIEGDGSLYSSHTYSRDDCSFREQILPDGYNIYISDRHGALLSLGNQRQRLQGRDRGVPALAQFLPRISTLDQTSSSGLDIPDQPRQSAAQTEEPVDTMDSFGKLSQIIHSPSFHKR
ncbi:fibroblast growth factor 19 [Seriola lalandi dorsalis]|uniref:Fibroblast growth factor n=1 Tax=Seriola lalandi dorsalis TaxID=1841481 RepID=A0A3B4XNA8_SERLL|nr:fibroblast growth factor 19 [Seriola lalandi dorsalis]XP_056234805.1 fibroblast growth factor 19 [Seriola aureovittata]